MELFRKRVVSSVAGCAFISQLIACTPSSGETGEIPVLTEIPPAALGNSVESFTGPTKLSVGERSKIAHVALAKVDEAQLKLQKLMDVHSEEALTPFQASLFFLR